MSQLPPDPGRMIAPIVPQQAPVTLDLSEERAFSDLEQSLGMVADATRSLGRIAQYNRTLLEGNAATDWRVDLAELRGHLERGDFSVIPEGQTARESAKAFVANQTKDAPQPYREAYQSGLDEITGLFERVYTARHNEAAARVIQLAEGAAIDADTDESFEAAVDAVMSTGQFTQRSDAVAHLALTSMQVAAESGDQARFNAHLGRLGEGRYQLKVARLQNALQESLNTDQRNQYRAASEQVAGYLIRDDFDGARSELKAISQSGGLTTTHQDALLQSINTREREYRRQTFDLANQAQEGRYLEWVSDMATAGKLADVGDYEFSDNYGNSSTINRSKAIDEAKQRDITEALQAAGDEPGAQLPAFITALQRYAAQGHGQWTPWQQRYNQAPSLASSLNAESTPEQRKVLEQAADGLMGLDDALVSGGYTDLRRANLAENDGRLTMNYARALRKAHGISNAQALGRVGRINEKLAQMEGTAGLDRVDLRKLANEQAELVTEDWISDFAAYLSPFSDSKSALESAVGSDSIHNIQAVHDAAAFYARVLLLDGVPGSRVSQEVGELIRRDWVVVNGTAIDIARVPGFTESLRMNLASAGGEYARLLARHHDYPTGDLEDDTRLVIQPVPNAVDKWAVYEFMPTGSVGRVAEIPAMNSEELTLRLNNYRVQKRALVPQAEKDIHRQRIEAERRLRDLGPGQQVPAELKTADPGYLQYMGYGPSHEVGRLREQLDELNQAGKRLEDTVYRRLFPDQDTP